MSKLTNRVNQLEVKAGKGAYKKYMCVIGSFSWDGPKEPAEGYKIQPLMSSAGGTGGEPFYLATLDEVHAFAARPDVELILIEIEYASEAIPDQPSE